jgi:ubiquinone/menaquinone biosynthesis C-methylase UbiE
MKEINLLEKYPNPISARKISGKNERTIKNKIAASYRDIEYFDGDRNNGYGGFNYDGRWLKVLPDIFEYYKLRNKSKILQIGSEKGFLLSDILKINSNMLVHGVDTSNYAIENTKDNVKKYIKKVEHYYDLPYPENSFDLIIVIGAIYTLNIHDAIRCLLEIKRIGKGASFITLATYDTADELDLFRKWSLLGTTILLKEEWLEILQHVDYTGEYYFVSAKTLKLEKND